MVDLAGCAGKIIHEILFCRMHIKQASIREWPACLAYSKQNCTFLACPTGASNDRS